ncbi:hypothetical protein CU669_20480 [Paramagnetospirillum kuznetsovii]|uniref:Phosphate ABC transporter substrate-binding protein n=1 Tax=Paramagnetospirillum kuznetsovii TaxID=2053833 RepID=A0A364NT19_9PROT|nr:phosphate/phosphite/phosphonate ABC transporter substrate-binding protein [Paramagnetospirillum kuznetsovii]RAU20055.1 hypothetical protein CU669_20480 [Paramagnetospirillum kuznetsovii]
MPNGLALLRRHIGRERGTDDSPGAASLRYTCQPKLKYGMFVVGMTAVICFALGWENRMLTNWVSRVMLTLGILAFGTPVALAEDAPIKLIILPYANTVSIMKVHQPLRLFLQERLGRPVEMFTSADFSGHFDQIRQGNFDVAITGPHFGAWAVDNGHKPLLRYSPTLTPVLAIAKGGEVKKVADLKGRTVALSNRISTSSLAGEKWLADQGMIAGRDYVVRASPTHTAAIMAVSMGEVDAAITTHTPIHQAPEDVRNKLTVLESPYHAPHLFTIANGHLDPAMIASLREALLRFEASEAGKTFFNETGYKGYAPLTPEDVESMRPIVALFLPHIDGKP